MLEGPFLCPRLGIGVDGIRVVLAFVDYSAIPYYLIKRGGRHVGN